MTIRNKILIIEDEETILRFMTTILTQGGYKVLKAKTGAGALLTMESQCPNLIILDLGLPDIDGVDILKQLRSWTGIPVLVVSARTTEKDKVEAFELGADDYICKPFGTQELLARVRTALRHVHTYTGNIEVISKGTFTVRELTVDFDRCKVFRGGQDCGLTGSEYRIVELLAIHEGKVLTYDFIMKELWGPRMGKNNRILRVHMANIRRKIETNPGAPEYLYTQIGVGYRLAVE